MQGNMSQNENSDHTLHGRTANNKAGDEIERTVAVVVPNALHLPLARNIDNTVVFPFRNHSDDRSGDRRNLSWDEMERVLNNADDLLNLIENGCPEGPMVADEASRSPHACFGPRPPATTIFTQDSYSSGPGHHQPIVHDNNNTVHGSNTIVETSDVMSNRHIAAFSHSCQSPSNSSQSFFCDVCMTFFTSEIEFTNHVSELHERTWIECMYCDRVLATQCRWNRHLIDHIVYNVWICSKCGSRMDSAEDLAAHKLLVHRVVE